MKKSEKDSSILAQDLTSLIIKLSKDGNFFEKSFRSLLRSSSHYGIKIAFDLYEDHDEKD
jgi:hypothetical protein